MGCGFGSLFKLKGCDIIPGSLWEVVSWGLLTLVYRWLLHAVGEQRDVIAKRLALHAFSLNQALAENKHRFSAQCP